MELQTIYLAVTVALAAISTTQAACPPSPSTTAVITGLFPIHSDSGCSIANIRALQQIAALKATVNSINSENNGLTINLKVHDTCSSPDEAVKAALKALVDPEQMCQNPPFFMGFIGPENVHVLNAVHEVTHVFNTTHIVPFTFNAANLFSDNSVFQVATRKSEEQAQSIITVLQQVQWKSFSLAIDDSHESNLLATALLPLVKQDASTCIKGKIAQLTDDDSIKLALAGNSGYGIVVLVDSAEKAERVLNANKDTNAPMILVVTEIGLRAWQIPKSGSTLVILQEVSADTIVGLEDSLNSTLYSQYMTSQEQLCKSSGSPNECTTSQDVLQGSLDSSLQPLSYSVRLMTAALQSALKVKCAASKVMCSQLIGMPVAEWRRHLSEATTFVKQGSKPRLPTILRFQMELTTAFEVYSKSQQSSTLEKIGLITSGKKLTTLNGKSLPAAAEPVLRDTKCSGEVAQAIPTEWLSQPRPTPAVVLQPVDNQHEIETELFDIVLLLCGAGLGILIFFILMTYVVYSSFIVKDDDKSQGGGSFKATKPISRIAKWRRGSGQSSRASIRTIN
ncbi:uncharacterized protein LOC111057657 [Nilaparvata lugens]|uniref:uncharacterized protein LOC111057657 n=1 Tax=Nilaparvata lugens TaxID=108931 RepID=UPI00193CFF0E|nr:uncharacterized protein LOC111057657 [Nilaparvata lugens]